MSKGRTLLYACITWAVAIGPAHAWFFFILPLGAMQRAMETDPDTIVVSGADRLIAKCAGFHVNQAMKFAAPPGDPDDRRPLQTPESGFHSEMADLAVGKAGDKDKVRDLAKAYSTRWGRVASADVNANRAYGADLAQGCFKNDIPLSLADWKTWKDRQEAADRQREAHERQRREEEQRRQRAESEAQRAVMTQTSLTNSSDLSQIDYSAEARKSARILGCVTNDVRVTGAEAGNIFFTAMCETGSRLELTCDKSGLCLSK